MPDLTHLWGNDLAWSPTGDLATADAPALTEQRVLRRLLTTQAEYIWQLDYGASLPSFVGLPGAALAIRAAIRAQLSKEAAIAQDPRPRHRPDPRPGRQHLRQHPLRRRRHRCHRDHRLHRLTLPQITRWTQCSSSFKTSPPSSATCPPACRAAPACSLTSPPVASCVHSSRRTPPLPFGCNGSPSRYSPRPAPQRRPVPTSTAGSPTLALPASPAKPPRPP